ncbi:acyl-CoA ligase (AMP-forming), exosortase A system-associated [Rheinheimera sp. MMS21-TC3]|uniref:acyl-CoA ligase (AMP-forming), exosortase A system-associated n=1 Tax=Rheinheimera sp. MMS21-TC3 TaxID=3072790 RepID=UPI0028C462B8|nr:acyl-CoA ligase (AMP-forming), exosortase A system-associated [Rheinheimera sp. MMS21-TC3]WNO62279.1 acyl-CoA ligase (AMP-forming), exosortase A system-associated [Rheinheimera sp. MMS21-TC3]
MTKNIHDYILQSAVKYPNHPALYFKSSSLTYSELAKAVTQTAALLLQSDLKRFERVAVYLPKQFETVSAIFGCSMAGGVFVPVNAGLKAPQVSYILQDCSVKVLITSKARLTGLADELVNCPDLETIFLTDADDNSPQKLGHIQVLAYHNKPITLDKSVTCQALTDADMAAILYTSGSTGKPKGVVLSHRNMLLGAQSVASYLDNKQQDIILALLPLSFDYGLSQLTTAFLVGASVVLLDFFLVQDVVRTVEKHQVTAIAAVPPLWSQLAKANWQPGSADSVRYITNSGGAMPQTLLGQLQEIFNRAEPFLMYGLTEAFRSTYLEPAELAKRPTSMGKAIPNAEIVVVREDGTLCGPNEPGELVHRGPLVSLGYWNAPEKTAERFKFDPVAPKGIQLPQLAVWSGDTVRFDEEGYLYFIGRRDEMIKSSGYRISPTEVEEAVYQLSSDLTDVAALGIEHAELGQAILVIFACQSSIAVNSAEWLKQLKRTLPNYMLPKQLIQLDKMPKNANGKIDRNALASQYRDFFTIESKN